MLALVVCVPVPALALSGLNVPLPSVVERVAAALVPFATAPTIEDGTTLASGRIVQAPDQETRVARSSGTTPATTVRVARHVRTTNPPAAAAEVVRTKAVPVVPAPAGPSSTFGEDTTAAAPASPAADSSTPAPAPTPPPEEEEEEKPKSPNRPTEPAPATPDVGPEPAETADVPPDFDVKPKPHKPVDEPVDEVVPDVKPKPDRPAPEPPKPEPPKRDPRNEKPLEADSGSGA